MGQLKLSRNAGKYTYRISKIINIKKNKNNRNAGEYTYCISKIINIK